MRRDCTGNPVATLIDSSGISEPDEVFDLRHLVDATFTGNTSVQAAHAGISLDSGINPVDVDYHSADSDNTSTGDSTGTFAGKPTSFKAKRAAKL